MIPNTRSVVAAAPVLGLVLLCVVLIFQPIPASNHDVVLSIVTGLLGFLAHPVAKEIVRRIAGDGSPPESSEEDPHA